MDPKWTKALVTELAGPNEVGIPLIVSGNTTVFQAEMSAIERCAENMLREKVEGRCIRICADSQASIKALENPSTTSALVKEAKTPLMNWPGQAKSSLPGSQDTRGIKAMRERTHWQNIEQNQASNWKGRWAYHTKKDEIP